MKRHKRGDRVYVLGSGPRAAQIKIAACRCGAKDTLPGTDAQRARWWREHREATS